MAANSYLTKGQPQFSDSGAPDTALDPSLVAQYAGIVGNRMVGTAAQRAAFAAIWAGFTGGPWNGLDFEETDTGIVYKRLSGAWKAWESGWITYTPTLVNVTVGTGGSAASSWAYKYVGGDIRVRGGLTLGTTGGAVSGIPTVSLPVNRTTLLHPFEPVPGMVTLYDTSDSRPYFGAAGADNANVDRVRLFPTNSGSVLTSISSTTPFTWGAGDSISMNFTYRPV